MHHCNPDERPQYTLNAVKEAKKYLRELIKKQHHAVKFHGECLEIVNNTLVYRVHFTHESGPMCTMGWPVTKNPID